MTSLSDYHRERREAYRWWSAVLVIASAAALVLSVFWNPGLFITAVYLIAVSLMFRWAGSELK